MSKNNIYYYKLLLVIAFFRFLTFLLVSILFININDNRTTRIEILNGTYDGCLYICSYKTFQFPATKINCMDKCEESFESQISVN